jgi:hypothetical protein
LKSNSVMRLATATIAFQIAGAHVACWQVELAEDGIAQAVVVQAVSDALRRILAGQRAGVERIVLLQRQNIQGQAPADAV